MGLERKRGDRKSTGKVLKIGTWSRGKDVEVFSKGRNAHGNDEN